MRYSKFDEEPEKAGPNNEVFKSMLLKTLNTLPNLSHNEYIPNKYPPDIQFAKLHGQANRVARVRTPKENEKIDVCECCGLQIQNEELPYCCDRIDLAEFGTGYPLYFEFVFYCIIMLFIIFCCLGIYGLLSNYETGDCSNPDANCDETYYINQISIPNKIFHPNEYYIQAWVNFGTVIAVMFSLHFFRRMQKLTEYECDRGVTSPSDYSVWLSKLPKGQYTEKDVRKIFEQAAARGGESVFEIKKVVMAFDISEFMKVCRKIEAVEKKIRQIKQFELKKGKTPEGPSVSELEDEKRTLEALSQEFVNEAEKMDHRMLSKTTGDVFVIFKEQDDRQFIEDTFIDKSKNLKQLFCCCESREGRLVIKDSIVQVQRSPEPNDVLWENLGYSDSYKLKKRIFTNFMTGFILVICFIIILAISGLQNQLSENTRTSSSAVKYAVKFLGYVGSFLIVFINSCLLITIRKFANLECHETLTNFNVSVAEKLSFAQFCNTAIIIFLANYLIYEVKSLFCDGGLVTDLYSVFLCNTFIPVLTTYFNPWYGWRLYKRWKIEKEGPECFFTQKEANEIYEGGPLDMAYKYGILVKTMWFTCFYSCILPVGILFSLINVTFTYFLDKYLILRRYARTPLLSAHLNREMVESLEYCPFIMSLGSLFFHILLYNPPTENLIPDILSIAVTSINFIFPAAKFNDMFCEVQEIKPDPTPYDLAKKTFAADYDRSNPVTQKAALDEYVKFMELGESSNKIAGFNSLGNYGRGGNNSVNNLLMNNIIAMRGNPELKNPQNNANLLLSNLLIPRTNQAYIDSNQTNEHQNQNQNPFGYPMLPQQQNNPYLHRGVYE